MIVARVQSHPSRRNVRGRLLEGLAGLPTEVVETEFNPPNPWRGYQACLASLQAETCSHALIVQDDAVACRNLPAVLERIAEAHPDTPVCLFLPMVSATRRDAQMAGARGEHYVDIVPRGFLPVVAVLWPMKQAMDFLEWSVSPPQLRRRNGQMIEQRSDDAMGYLWMRTRRTRCVATIPCLVQHPDDVPSTIAKKNSGRTALFWHGGDWDPLTLDWSH
jgi:hypothetical protein